MVEIPLPSTVTPSTSIFLELGGCWGGEVLGMKPAVEISPIQAFVGCQGQSDRQMEGPGPNILAGWSGDPPPQPSAGCLGGVPGC